MARSLRLGVLLVAVLATLACSTQGEECDPCTADADCSGGYVCSAFSDGVQRCGTGNTASPTSCRVQ
jgi:hypothetical protein